MSRALSEQGYREHAPASIQELPEAVGRFEQKAAESDRQLEAVRRAGEEIREYWSENEELFDPAGDGATRVELDAQFIDREIPLFDSVWILADSLSVIDVEYPEVYEDIQQVQEVLTQDCELKCTKARVDVESGPGANAPILYNHAWLRYRTRMERTCEALPPETQRHVEELGFFGENIGIRSDIGRESDCNTEEWVGNCAEGDFQYMLGWITNQRRVTPEWKLPYNCADWALDALDRVDPALADELHEKAYFAFDIIRPSDLC